jgi:hypothetical protein
MKTSTLLLAAFCTSAVALNTASAGSAHIDLGSLHIVINGGSSYRPPYQPGYFPPSPPPIYRPTPSPFPTPAPRPAPAPAPQAVIPANMQGNWVERYPDGTVWYHRLDADGTHLTTTVPVNGASATSTTRASFSDGKLTISNGTYFAGLDPNGDLDLAVPGGRRRIWARSGGGVAPAPRPAPQPVRPNVQQSIAGTWYEQTTGRDGSPVLFRYDVNADSSYDMFMYPRTASGWDFANPIGHLADKASAEARQWTFDGTNLILGPGQSFQEGPMQVKVNGSGITLSSTRGERNWNRNP